MNEIEAVVAMKNGDRSAFRYLFNTFYDRLVAYITTNNHDKVQSEDIVQHAFIRLWEDRSKLDETKSPKAYLYAIAYNRYIDTIKKAKKQEKLLSQIWERALLDRIEEDSDALEKRIQKMKQVIDSLPPKCREIIMLNKTQGVKYKDIAEQMGISIKTVESQMRIAFTKIREAFKEDPAMLFLLFK
ncbi:RNA polymerase sigma-70 factor [Arenibacter sp. BSSL-BM3]|uniref:RNA polymerase sigma-70 factor n=1 Tax=Arenibacter arenosicollis TaxID=2762274 RepID=A0ABR7QRM1_9FLAO|nr:RNA polymerase sigma-70 factor [Arenibacter arenosicollis]MBC8769562.1 RNA polymerase sigma-70 factor [Arenibacter arenosicollis]